MRISYKNSIKNAILENLENNQFTVDSLSKTLCVSKATLFRKCVYYYNKTPHELIAVYRLKKAKEYLSNDDIQVQEVAYDLGYSSSQYFSRKFSQHFGSSPRSVKKKSLNFC